MSSLQFAIYLGFILLMYFISQDPDDDDDTDGGMMIPSYNPTQ